MNRAKLQQLAEDRIVDAQALLAAQRWSGAYYLAGYAVECAKACIAKLTNEYDFPNRTLAQKSYTHNIDRLVEAAQLELVLKDDADRNPSLDQNLQIVKDWNEETRYQQKTQPEAERLYSAVTNNANGVLQWIKNHW